jgi:hypothetical protein
MDQVLEIVCARFDGLEKIKTIGNASSPFLSSLCVASMLALQTKNKLCFYSFF